MIQRQMTMEPLPAPPPAESQNGLAAAAVFNIGAVARLTGLSMAALRAWERRYGFPQAARSAGGQRAYSQRDIEALRWVKARLDQGMQAGQAIRALHHLRAEGAGAGRSAAAADAAAPRVPAAPSGPAAPHLEPIAVSSPATPGTAHAAFAARLLAALMAHDLAAADRLLAEALALLSLEEILLEVLRPSLAALGEAWEAGQASVATEHLASAYLRQRLLLWLSEGAPTRPVPPTVLACAPGDWHELGLLFLAVLLRRRLWPIHYLGPAVPLDDLRDFVRRTRPAAVVLVATLPQTAQALREDLAALAPSPMDGVPMAFAGPGFGRASAAGQGLPGPYLGTDLPEGLRRMEALLRDSTGVLT